MSLLKWIQNTSSNPSKTSTTQSGTISSSNPGPSTGPGTLAGDVGSGLTGGEGPNDKRFGMENALYFCQPFRDLLVAGYESPAAAPPAASSTAQSSTPAPASTVAASAATPAKQDPNAPQPPAIPSNPATLHAALRSLFYHIARHPSGKGVVAPQAFITKLKKENVLFRSSMHQDAHEFLNYLLNKVVEDLEDEGKGEVLTKSISSLTSSTSTSSGPSADSLSRSPPPPTPPLIQSLFQGTLTNETRCLTCERVTSRSEPFLDLSLDISQNTSLNACLRHFSKSEMLTARNKFFCDECCGLVEAEKRMKIKTLPPVLLLHLKRFKYQEELQKYVKLSYRVAFPLELRLYNNTVDPTSADIGPEGRGRRRTPHDFGDGVAGQEEAKGAGSGGPGDPEGLYRLFAVVVHIGGGPHHGHYITLVKASTTWLLFDDDSVEPIKESDIPKYFGDSNFTVEAAIAAANAAATAQATGAGTAVASLGGTAVVGGMISVSGGLVSSAKVLAANPAGSSATTAGAKSNTTTTGTAGTGAASGQTGTSTGTTTGNASMGSGYVLLYQAANIDLKGLGLISAAQEATEAGIAALEAAAAREPKSIPPKPTPVPVVADNAEPAHPQLAQIFVEEPEREEPVVVKDVAGSSSPSFVSSSPSSSSPAIPSISPGHSPSHLTAPYPNGITSSPSESATSTSTSTGKDQVANGRGLSLELPPTIGPVPAPLDDQLSPLILPPSVHAQQPPPSNGGGFFKSLKHSASVNVGKHTGGGLGGLGMGLASPTALAPKDKEASPRKSSSGAGASTPVLPSSVNGDANHLAPPSLPPMPPVPIKEKEKDKLSGWFSSARKSVKRRSRNKSKEKDENSKIGTASFSSAVSDKDSSQPSSAKTPALDTNGYGGWSSGNGGWAGINGGTHDPASAAGPKHSGEERRASEPSQGGETVRMASVTPRPLSMADPQLSDGAPLPTEPDHSSWEHLPRSESPSTPKGDGVLTIPRTRTKSPSPKTPNGSVPPSPLQPRIGRYAPRKSLTLDHTNTAPSSFAVGLSPIPREGKDENGAGVLKRASRKMSLSSNTIRLSGFGWNKDKDKDRS
ncbi:hypothetical protein FRC04_005017 [Tulasnella sp. 424]|nr:hypothetical protein FRC04_005017 [Tulasnella sp. 424]KAG8963364.1 hypothetical protein FRC05_004752 [Tulasnella sp. 425]